MTGTVEGPRVEDGRDASIDSVLLVGFGGPSSPEEIMPFLRRVVQRRGVPDARLREVARHYEIVGGRSPYNELTQRQADALARWLETEGRPLPVYVGMRNWRPELGETVATMAAEGRAHAAGIVLSAHRSEVSWQRYIEDVARARAACGPAAPRVSFLEPWYDDPGFLEASASRLEEATGRLRGSWPASLPVIFTAHSIPAPMAAASPYVQDLTASCRGVAALLGLADWQLAYQSRSGDPRAAWLEPDVRDALRRRAASGTAEVAVQPIGFLSDHVEVLYDLDVEAAALCRDLGMAFHRAPCVNAHPTFVAMLGRRVRGMQGSAR